MVFKKTPPTTAPRLDQLHLLVSLAMSIAGMN